MKAHVRDWYEMTSVINTIRVECSSIYYKCINKIGMLPRFGFTKCSI